MNDAPMHGFLMDAAPETGLDPRGVAAAAAHAEAQGYEGIGAAETQHDPFVTLAAAAMTTERLTLTTAIAVAFARNPMSVAETANDLQLLSRGRFVLGLGSQVQPHIERRFSMPWSAPAARMREFVAAVRAIWSSWERGERLRFQGEHYRHTLMSPFFDPGPNPFGAPPIWLAAVGERMTEAAGAVADGVIAHCFTTPRYLTEVTLPALARGAASAGRDGAEVGLSLPAFVAVGRTPSELDAAVRATRRQIAFYGSTPDYLPVLGLHGWESLHERLHAAARRGQWETMGDAVDDEVLTTFAAVGTPAEVAAQLHERFGGLVSRLSFASTAPMPDETSEELLAAMRKTLADSGARE